MQFRDPCPPPIGVWHSCPVTITESPPRLPSPAPRRLRSRLWWLVLLWPALVLFQMAQSTWQGLDVYEEFHGLDMRARNLAGQEWTLDRTASNYSDYWVNGLSAGDTVKTWTDVTQNGHFGIATRIDGIADPVGPVHLVEVTATSDSEANSYPFNGSPIGNTTQLPTTLEPGSSVTLNVTWSLTSCHPPGVEPATVSVHEVDVHETVLGVPRTRPLSLGYTLNLVEPECPTG